MKQLHPTQQSLLDLLKANITDPLTIRELQEELDISSPSVVHHHIRQLEKRGFIKRNPGNSKDYMILSSRESPIVYLNLYGMAQCGPNGQLLTGDPEDRIPISSKLLHFPAEEGFLVTAKGDSMEPKIQEGDLIIAHRSKMAQNSETVVCSYQGQVLVKQFFKQENQIVLQSTNPKYSPIVANFEDVGIEGIVKGNISFS